MDLIIFLMLCIVSEIASGQPAPPFDGVIRVTSDGRGEAYMVPPFSSNHASNIEILPNEAKMGDDMIISWTSGPGEGASGAAVVTSYLHAGAREFANATVLSQKDGYTYQNPVAFFYNTTKEKKLFLFHSAQKDDDEHRGPSQVYVLEADPEATNWTEAKAVLTKPGDEVRNRMLLSLNETAFLPIYRESEHNGEAHSSFMEWTGGNIDDSSKWTEHTMPQTNHLIQPSVVRPKPGQPRLIAFFRDRRREYIYRAISEDDGHTWSRPTKTTLPNNDSGIQACVLTSGNIALVYNPSTTQRNPLVISLSEDEGQTWRYTRTLIGTNDTQSEFSSPSILQDSRSGVIHITHTYDRKTIKYNLIPNESWIKAKTG